VVFLFFGFIAFAVSRLPALVLGSLFLLANPDKELFVFGGVDSVVIVIPEMLILGLLAL
jgi:hypothetical protein